MTATARAGRIVLGTIAPARANLCRNLCHNPPWLAWETEAHYCQLLLRGKREKARQMRPFMVTRDYFCSFLLSSLLEMAWKRSSVRSRPGPPNPLAHHGRHFCAV